MQTALTLTGLFAFGVSGALMAIRHEFDVVGIALLAVITALGGGLVRDVVLGHTPPPAFTRWEYLVVPLAGAALAYVARVERFSRTLLVFDAAGLGLFSVAGTLKALDYGLGPIAATVLGVTTAVGGGVLRDVIARENPQAGFIRSGSELYAVPAAAGAAIVALAWELGVQRQRCWGPRRPWRCSRSEAWRSAVNGTLNTPSLDRAGPRTFPVSGVVGGAETLGQRRHRRPGSPSPAPRAWP